MSMETVLGGVDATVLLLNGTKEQVKVRQVPVRELPRLLIATGNADEAAMAEVYCNKPTGWADTILPAEVERIVIEGDRINADFFARWLARRNEREARLFPGQQEQLLRAAAEAALKATLLSSPTGSPTSPSPAA